MNLGQLKDKTLNILREYSNGGDIIPQGDNKDYLFSIPGAISDAQVEISKIRPVLKEIVLDIPTLVTSKYMKFAKPTGYKQIFEITFNDEPFTEYFEQMNYICIPVSLQNKGEFVLTYDKVPQRFSLDVSDTYELEIDEDVQHITCFYAASIVYTDDNLEMANYFGNEYKRLLTSIDSKKRATMPSIVALFTP